MKDMPIGLRFSIIQRAFRKRMDERLREQGLTGVQIGVLAQLGRLEDAGERDINQHTLEKAARVTHPTMTEIIKRLEKKGYIECTVNPTDRRSKCIASTKKTRSLTLEMFETDREVFEELCVGLSKEQIAQLIDLTDVMLQNIAAKGCDCEK